MAFELGDVVVRKDAKRRTAEPRPIDEGGVTKLIEDDDIRLPNERWDRSERGGIAGGKESAASVRLNRAIAASSNSCSRWFPQIRRDAPTPVPPFESRHRRLAQARVRGEAEVVVRRKIDEPRPVDDDLRALRGIEFPQLAKQTRRFDLTQRARQKVIEGSAHGPSRSSAGSSRAPRPPVRRKRHGK